MPPFARRSFLAAGLLGSCLPAAALPKKALQFPRDHGAHPGFRTEWWYITGHATSGGREFGFQVTFFRSRVDGTQGMQSGFAARQLIFAHAAVTDVQGKKLLHDQRIAREGFDVATAGTTDTQLKLRDWSLVRADGGYQTRIAAQDFALDLSFAPTQALLLQGDRGLSRKGPQEKQASYYYSQPQLKTRGTITLRGQRLEVQGTAWLDHEWSEELLHPEAVGWDWIGMNLFDGSALTAFVLRRADGSSLWAGGSYRRNGGGVTDFPPDAVQWAPGRVWRSPATATSYPVQWQLQTPAGRHTVRALADAQELDSRNSTGAVYWEGLSELQDERGLRVGLGYLEMTGYVAPLRLG